MTRPESKPEGWQTPVPMRLVDLAENARQMFGANVSAVFPDLPQHDFRFEAYLRPGSTVTFSRSATAEHIAVYLKREGVDLSADERAETQAVVRAWMAGARPARTARQERMRAEWPALAEALDALASQGGA